MSIVNCACSLCGTLLETGDFSKGRAVMVVGEPFCQKCMARAKELGRPSARESRRAHRRKGDTSIPRPDEIPADVFERSPEEEEEIRRLSEERKAPPVGAELLLRKSGIRGLFGGNAVVLWLDVSRRGGRAIMKGTFAVDDVLSLLLVYKERGERIEAEAIVKHVGPSEQYPGCALVGFRFDKRSPLLKEFLKGLVEESPGSSPSRCLGQKLA